MKTLMGWVLESLIASVLLITISVVFTYLTVSNKFRIIYIVVSSIVVWLLYMLSVYFVICRPLSKAVEEFSRDQVNSGAAFCRDELNEVNRVVELMLRARQVVNKDLKEMKSTSI